MKTNQKKEITTPLWFSLGLLFTGIISYTLLSPKWVVPLCAWIAPFCLLYFSRHVSIKWKDGLFLLTLFISLAISSYDVAPFPLPVLVIVTLINVAKIYLVFLLDRYASRKFSGFWVTLIFPAAFVTKEFIDISMSGGAWFSIANTQYGFLSLIQISSVTGLSGISFIIYWFASVAVWAVENYKTRDRIVKGSLVFGGVFAAILVFGIIRSHKGAEQQQKVKIAGVIVSTIPILEGCYLDVNHEPVSIDLKSQLVSSKLQRVNAAMASFIEDPDPEKFPTTWRMMTKVNDSLFLLSKIAAQNGAKIIVWSEADAIMPQSLQDTFIKSGVSFARNNKVYLLMTMGVFTPGKVTFGKKWLENKAILISPGGTILNVFHKNHPVPFAEPSEPGDGKVPVIATPYGNLAVSICYDADMPSDMRQLSRRKADILLLPSGDWYDIAPYHSYMAMFRGIENGCYVFRQANGGLSLLTNPVGKNYGAYNFYNTGAKLWYAEVSPRHMFTWYSVIGDAFAYFCMVFTGGILIVILYNLIRARFNSRRINQYIFPGKVGKQPHTPDFGNNRNLI